MGNLLSNFKMLCLVWSQKEIEKKVKNIKLKMMSVEILEYMNDDNDIFALFEDDSVVYSHDGDLICEAFGEHPEEYYIKRVKIFPLKEELTLLQSELPKYRSGEIGVENLFGEVEIDFDKIKELESRIDSIHKEINHLRHLKLL